jgi:hypothetical protein
VSDSRIAIGYGKQLNGLAQRVRMVAWSKPKMLQIRDNAMRITKKADERLSSRAYFGSPFLNRQSIRAYLRGDLLRDTIVIPPGIRS